MGEEECCLEEIEDESSKKVSLWTQFENHVKAISDDSSHLLEIGTKVNLKTPSTHFAKVKRELEKEEKAKEKPSLNSVSFIQSCTKGKIYSNQKTTLPSQKYIVIHIFRLQPRATNIFCFSIISSFLTEYLAGSFEK